MKFTEKLQRRIRNSVISLTIILLTPCCEKGKTLSGAHSVNPYTGESLICAIDLGDDMYGSHGLETGLSYKLLENFAEANHCEIEIVAAKKGENYIDSLKQNKVDLVITHARELEGLHAMRKINDCSSWVMNTPNRRKIRQMNSWIGHIKASGEFDRLKKLYSIPYNPHNRAEKGIRTSTVSPYDDIIRKHAETLGWDWRMVAAVIWQESKFSISSRSSRGAQGLMQVMPQTGKHYGIDNLLDPEQNIAAGTSHLKRLQNIFRKYDLTQEELIKFTLAAYNAGEGRIIDCRNLAEARGYDNGKWEEIVKVIPLMREDSILEDESVKLGKFQGHETINYIESVISHYQAICQICPTSF